MQTVRLGSGSLLGKGSEDSQFRQAKCQCGCKAKNYREKRNGAYVATYAGFLKKFGLARYTRDPELKKALRVRMRAKKMIALNYGAWVR